jgi:hypothetical protein
LPNTKRFGHLRRSTLSWCRRTRTSASNAALGRNTPIKAHQINLQTSLIGREYQPIRGRGQPSWVCGRDKGQPENETAFVHFDCAVALALPHHAHERRIHGFPGLFVMGFIHAISERAQQNVRERAHM